MPGIHRRVLLKGAVTTVGATALGAAFPPPSHGASQPVRFAIHERFGVSHPDQIVDFDLDFAADPANTRLLDDAGREVACQVLSGGKRLALRTDLPAGSRKSWRLAAGRRPAATRVQNAVTVERDAKAAWFEIANGLTGFRVPLPAQEETGPPPPPILGVRLRSGAWLGAERPFDAGKITKRTIRFAEKGPLVTTVEVAYAFASLSEAKPGEPEGYYRCTITLQAGQPSILFEEETNAKVSYTLRLDPIRPTQARYRGHHASAKEAGYEPDGQPYRPIHARPPLDATVDLNAGEPREYPRIAIWNPWVADSGWYWQTYNRDAPAGGDLVGVFSGPASRARDAREAENGVCFFMGSGGAAGYRVTCHRAKFAPNVRFSRFAWGLFVGTKADLARPAEIQPVARQMNLHAGIGLNKLRRLTLDFPDPSQGYGSPYMKPGALARRIERLRRDTEGPHGKGYYHTLFDADPQARDLMAMWADPSGKKRETVANEVEATAREILNSLVNEDGVYTFVNHYWIGGLKMSRYLLWLDQVLGSNAATPEQKARMKAVAVLFAAILWDNDFVPMDNHRGINLGTPNMPVQQSGYRSQFAVFLARHPMMKNRVAEATRRAKEILNGDINAHGAHIGSVHYVEAGMGPTLNLMQQLQRAGLADLFQTEPRAARFARFYLNAATAPEPRFGGLRKLISVGDGSTESSTLFGQMGTGFAPSDPDLSRQLMGMWKAQGERHGSFHGTTLLKIDENLPAAPVHLSSANVRGWFSVLRHGAGAAGETTVWFVNGNHYVDHAHEDQGQVVIYALGAPLSLDWGCMYSPRVAGAHMHSLALPESVFPKAWDQESSPDEEPGRWGTWRGTKTEAAQFHALAQGGWTRARMTAPDGKYVWARAVSLAHLADDLPVIALRDTYSGEGAGTAKVFTLNLMAEGAVQTPAGPITPEERIWGHETHHGDKKQSASVGKVFALKPGVNRLGFTGQVWKSHSSGGIDWDVYVVSPEAQQAHVGNWAHAWHPNGERAQFQATNGRSFEERQHILRLRGDAFWVLIVPYRKGRRPEGLEVKTDGSNIAVSLGTKSVRFGEKGEVLSP